MDISGRVTVVRKRPTGRGAVAGWFWVVVVGVFGDLLELVGYVFVAVAKLPPVRRWLEREDAAPDQLEVRDDRVTAVGPQAGRVIRRVDGAVLTVGDDDGSPVLHVPGAADARGTIDLTGYDVDEVGAAALAHGWPWQPAGGAVTYPQAPASSDEPAPEFAIVLREGWNRPVPARAVQAVALGCVGAGVVGYFVAHFARVPGLPAVAVLFAMALLAAVCVLVIAFLWHRLSRVTFAADGDRIVVSYGAVAELVVRRAAVVAGTVGRRWVRLEESGRWRARYLPIAPRRREVLAALVGYGWPVTDGGER